MAVHIRVELVVVYTFPVSVVELDDLGGVELAKGGPREIAKYPSGLGNFNNRELIAIEALHLRIEFFVTDDEDDVYWE